MSPLVQGPKEVPAKLRKRGSGFVVTSEAGVSVDIREQIRVEVNLDERSARLLIERKKPDSYATHCGVPMIPTSAFFQAELYCMECGAKIGLFSPWARSQPATAELHRAFEKVAREWDEHVGPFILADRRDARNDKSREANEKARAWLEERCM